MHVPTALRSVCLLLALSVTSFAGAAEALLEVTENTTLDPAKTYGRIVIKTSGITIDGRGAWLVGAPHDKTKEYQGTAISAEGVNNVTLKNLNAKQWEIGLALTKCQGWTVENCNFSDNFHDPDFGWGENGRRGGIVLQQVRSSTFRACQANRVWDACVLVDSHDNKIEDCDFSHTSNTCLKLWNATANQIRKCNLSYGLRISPGEVHARDSTSVLLESGSNDNILQGNNCTHGGDGIFVRVLNGWVSTGNLFEDNDCSYANNNCVEAWSPRNTYRRNKANHGSYGFWLGASDQTVLVDNEASYNGLAKGFHNSPHLPKDGHAGIVFMFGPSSHTIVRGNHCIGNNGAGIAVIGDIDSKGQKWKAFHWIIEQNTLADNRWGIYAQYADWLTIGANTYRQNQQGDFFDAGGLTNVRQNTADAKDQQAPSVKLVGPDRAVVGESVKFDAAGNTDPTKQPLQYRWDLGDGTIASTAAVEHTFQKPGFYRVGLTVTNGVLSDLAWRDLYVVAPLAENEVLVPAGSAAEWNWQDSGSKVQFSDDEKTRLVGSSSLRANIQPYSGGRLNLLYPQQQNLQRSLAGKTKIVVWIKAINEGTPAWQDANPIVTLYESDKKFVRLTPKTDLLSSPPYNEAREGWFYFEIPIAGDAHWQREGAAIDTLNSLTIGFDSWGAPPLTIWIAGLGLK